MYKRTLTALLVLSGTAVFAQVKPLPLDDMSAFKSQAGNWQIVGDVSIDRNVDIHHEAAKPAAETGKKKKKSVAPAETKAVTTTAGKGVLINLNDDTKKDNLVTVFEHGDIELELEVMIPKGSNSGIYLQGRYEVQLLDSWGVKNPAYSDIGGIYRNWETQPDKIYMGKAPILNAAKAPGLWQKMKISFRAPKFDASGKKIANAKFVSVELNGVKIHDNVEVPHPTGGPIVNNETAMGPLMIQGDHGPVAFRNVRYKVFKSLQASVSDITYQTFKGSFGEVKEFAGLKPATTGSAAELTIESVYDENDYGVIFKGKVTVPEDNNYKFQLNFSGGAKLIVDGQTIIDLQNGYAWERRSGSIQLKAGTHDFEIDNYKVASWLPPRIGFYVSTESSYPVTLSAYNSYPPDDDPTSPILIHAGATPKILRAFVDFKGDRGKRLTHTVGVGEGTGINYIYDTESGNLVCVWRGDFVDATPMWHDRGDGSFRPLGSPQYLFTGQPLAFLGSANDAFPALSSENDFRNKGYALDANGRPTFKFIYQGLEVEDRVTPEDENRSFSHEVTIKNRGDKQGLYYKLAEGKTIERLSDGSYAIDDKQYYIKPASAATVREVNGTKELVVLVDGSSVKYSIIW